MKEVIFLLVGYHIKRNFHLKGTHVLQNNYHRKISRGCEKIGSLFLLAD